MLDILSVLLGVTGLLQNSNRKASLDHRIGDIKAVLRQVDRTYAILQNAKTLHDHFQTMNGFFPGKDLPLDSTRSLAFDEKKATLEKIIGQHKRFSRRLTLSLLPAPTKDEIQIAHLENASVDSIVKQESMVAIAAYEKMYLGFKGYEAYISGSENSIEKYLHEEDFGKDFEICFSALGSSMRTSFDHADQLIISITPVLSNVNQQVLRTLEST